MGEAWGLAKGMGFVVCPAAGQCLGPKAGFLVQKLLLASLLAHPRAKSQPGSSGCVLGLIHRAPRPSAGGPVCNDCDDDSRRYFVSALPSETFRVGAAGGDRSRV